MSRVHAVLPAGVDDPARPSGGNRYDRQVLSALRELGWDVSEHEVVGGWPFPGPDDLDRLDAALARLPDGALLLVDGLIASGAASVLPHAAGRLRVVVLLHMPVGPARGEELVLTAADAVVATSAWSASRLRDWYGLRHVHVARPGTDPAVPARGSGSGGGTAFLTVAAVHPGKGLDLLLEALARLGDRAWTLTCVGSLEVDPDHVTALQTQVYARSWERRVIFTGALSGTALAGAYDAADLVVHPSRFESYGMVATEALAREIPVVATDVGGIAEALGTTPEGSVPGLLVPAEDAAALASALSRWLDDPSLRQRLARAAARRTPHLRRWTDTAADLAGALDHLSTGSSGSSWLGAGR